MKFWFGLFLTVIGGWVWLATMANNNTCKTWIGAFDQSQCSGVEFWHTIGLITALIGVALIVWGIVAHVKAQDDS